MTARRPFVDVDGLVVNASWASVFRMAPVLDELSVQHPQIHITRTGPQAFNFTDIVQRFASKPADPNASPTRFALSNISVHNGDITLDDKVLNATHHVDQIEVGIPFLANLPHDADIFVQPLLAMQIDGSPLHIAGQNQTFCGQPRVRDRFYAGSFRSAALSGLRSRTLASGHFKRPTVRQTGIAFHRYQARRNSCGWKASCRPDNFAMTTHDNAPMLELAHGSVALDDVEPLISRYYFGAIQLDQAKLHYAKLAGGRTNFDALLGKNQPPPKPGTPPTDAQIATLSLQNSSWNMPISVAPRPLASRWITCAAPFTDFPQSPRGLARST